MSGAQRLSMEEADREIRRIMDNYRVQAVFKARGQYAVWAGRDAQTEQVTQPTSHKDANAARIGLIASDLLDLFQDAGWSPRSTEQAEELAGGAA